MKNAAQLKTKWLQVWNYFVLPIGGAFNAFAAFTALDFSLGFVAVILASVQFLTAFGMHYRTKWAWKLNWLAILVFYYGGVINPRVMKHNYGIEEPSEQLILRIIVLALIWLWPNYIYWRKRKDLFSN